MVSVLWTKTRRELWSRKGSLLLLVCIAAIGVSLLVGMVGVIFDLDRARTAFYRERRLADFTVSLKRAPSWALDRVARLANVRQVQGRISVPVRVALPGVAESLVGTALSLPSERENSLNDILLTAGQWSSPRDGDVVVNAAFARARHLKLGESFTVVILDREWTLRIVGLAMSPEYVYVLPPGSFVPDPAFTPVLFLSRQFLAEAANLESACNEIVGRLDDNSPAAVRATLRQIEEQLTPYGVTYTTPQSEQFSVKFLENEFSELWSHATVGPSICLAAVAFVLHVVMGRLVAQDRGVVGTLRALGYSKRHLSAHYLGHGLLVGLLGGLCGTALGLWLQESMMALYRQFFELPDMVAHFHPLVALTGVAVSLLFAALGTLGAVRKAATLAPAQAMHPPPPERVGPILPERWPALWTRLPFRWKMILRSIFRNPMRTVTAMGVTGMATALLFESLCVRASLGAMVDKEFVETAHQDITITLSDPVALDCLREVGQLAGVSAVEAQLNVPSILRLGAAERRLGVLGVDPKGVLYTPLDPNGNPMMIPAQGLVLTRKLAEILHARLGDRIQVTPLIGLRRVADIPVVSIVDSWVGLSAYADRAYLSRLIGEHEVTSTLLASTWHARGQPQLVSQLQRRPRVLGIEQRLDSRARLNDLMQRSMGMSLWISLGFAGVLALGSVLNMALVSVSEREREVGTLRVLGYRPTEISAIFVGESLIVNSIGVVLGLPAGIGLLHAVMRVYNTELFRLPVIIPSEAWLEAPLLMATFLVVAQIAVVRMVGRLQWLDVFKVRE